MSNDGIVIIILVVVWLLVAAAGYVWYAWALSRLFKRLGTDSWRGWVPVVNEMTILERGGVPAWNVVFYFIPIVQLYGLYLKFTATQRIGEHFGRGVGMAILAVLFTPLWATLLVLQRAPGAQVAPQHVAQAAAHRQVAGGMASGQQPAQGMPHPGQPAPSGPQPGYPAPAVPQPHQSPESPTSAPQPAPNAASFPQHAPVPAPSTQAPAVQSEDSLSTPPTPMPEPAPPEVPATTSSPDSGPILVHNPWARPTVPTSTAGEPATPSSPPLSEAPAWLESPTSASAVVPQAAALADDDDGETVVVDRRPQVQWHLNVDGAAPLPLIGDKVILGRRPSATVPGTHPLAVPDTTRTLSKAHAQLELVDGEWSIKDLNSTNGVLIVDDSGEETLISPGEAVPVPGRFILGKVGMHISFEQAGE